VRKAFGTRSVSQGAQHGLPPNPVVIAALAKQGNGFITDTNIISRYGLSDANNFFSMLWDKPYVNKVGTRPELGTSLVWLLLSKHEYFKGPARNPSPVRIF